MRPAGAIAGGRWGVHVIDGPRLTPTSVLANLTRIAGRASRNRVGLRSGHVRSPLRLPLRDAQLMVDVADRISTDGLGVRSRTSDFNCGIALRADGRDHHDRLIATSEFSAP
jgi:hypothetical protein